VKTDLDFLFEVLTNDAVHYSFVGDPPNIIIGASFDEVGFVDFIVNVAPCIIIAAVPVSLLLMLWIYKPYMTMKPMAKLDSQKLKDTYPIYDEPRLYLAGTSTFFLILLFFLHPLHHKDTAWLALISAFLTLGFTNPHDVHSALRDHIEWDTLLFFAGLFVLVEVCAAMGLLEAIGGVLANVIKSQEEENQLPIAITLLLWVSAIASAFLDNIPYTATMIPVVRILANELPETLPIKTLAWALSFGACLGGNGTLLGASANIVTAGIATNKGYSISFMNFFYPGMLAMFVTVAISNIYMLLVFVWI
jgi:Na+/H+ antiporter NhaD/arsenite permease-like protein